MNRIIHGGLFWLMALATMSLNLQRKSRVVFF
jgi:hypothetical protein